KRYRGASSAASGEAGARSARPRASPATSLAGRYEGPKPRFASARSVAGRGRFAFPSGRPGDLAAWAGGRLGDGCGICGWGRALLVRTGRIGQKLDGTHVPAAEEWRVDRPRFPASIRRFTFVSFCSGEHLLPVPRVGYGGLNGEVRGPWSRLLVLRSCRGPCS